MESTPRRRTAHLRQLRPTPLLGSGLCPRPRAPAPQRQVKTQELQARRRGVSMLRNCVDMDEVMADTLAEYLRRYNQTFDEDDKPQDLAGKGLWDIAPLDRQQQLRDFLDAEVFFEDLDLMPGSQDVLRQLSSRFEIFIATQAMAVPNSLGSKYRWLQRHFPFIPPTHYVFCGDKSILRADYLIDDLPKNILRFEGQGLLYTAPHNLAATGFVRVNNWQQVEEYFSAVCN